MKSSSGLTAGTPMVRTHTLDPTPDAPRSYNTPLPIRLLIKDSCFLLKLSSALYKMHKNILFAWLLVRQCSFWRTWLSVLDMTSRYCRLLNILLGSTMPILSFGCGGLVLSTSTGIAVDEILSAPSISVSRSTVFKSPSISSPYSESS